MEYNGTITVTVSVNDLGSYGAPDAGMGLSATDTVALTVVAVNDAPTLSVTTDEGTFSVAEDGVTNAGEVMVTSSDAADGIPSAIVEYTVSVDEGGVVELDGSVAAYSMAMTDGRVSDVTGGGEGGEGAGTASGTLVFRCTTGDSVDVFSAVVVRPAANFYGVMTLSVEVDDLGSYDGISGSVGLVTVDNMALIVVPVNDVPTLSVTVGNGETLTIREDTMTSIESLTVEASDAADNLVASAALLVVVTIEEGAVDGGIVLVLPDSSSVMSNEGMSASELFGSDDIEIVAGGNGTATVTLECVEGLVDVAVSSVVFAPVLHFNGELNVNVTVSDQGSFGVEFADGTGLGGISMRAEDTLRIVVEAVNDAPTILVMEPNIQEGDVLRTLEDVSSSNGQIEFVVGDVDDPDTAVLSVVATCEEGGILYLNLNNSDFATFYRGAPCIGVIESGCAQIEGNFSSVLTLHGYESALNRVVLGLRFVSMPHFNGESSISISVCDNGYSGIGGMLCADADIGIVIDAVNDAPRLRVESVPGMLSTLEDTNSPVGSFMAVAEDDADHMPDNLLVHTVEVDSGASLFLAAAEIMDLEVISGIVISGNLTDSLSFTSIPSLSMSIFAALVIVPAEHFVGGVVVDLAVRDMGSFGIGGELSSSASTILEVIAVNDPVVLNGTVIGNMTEDRSSNLGDLIQISAMDVDGTDRVEITISMAANVSVFNGVSYAPSVTISSTTALVGMAIQPLSMLGDTDFFGEVEIVVSVTDTPNGLGEPIQTNMSFVVVVLPMNDAPVISVSNPSVIVHRDLETSVVSELTSISVLDVEALVMNEAINVEITVEVGCLSVNLTASECVQMWEGEVGVTEFNAMLDAMTYSSLLGWTGIDTVSIFVDDRGIFDSAPLNDTANVSIEVECPECEFIDYSISWTFDGPLVVEEAGPNISLSLRLSSQPAADVFVQVAAFDITVLQVVPSVVVFPRGTTDEVHVFVVAFDDNFDDGDQTSDILIGPSTSDDRGFRGMTGFDGVSIPAAEAPTVTAIDNDESGVSLSVSTEIVDETIGLVESFVVLDTIPIGVVSVDVVVISERDNVLLMTEDADEAAAGQGSSMLTVEFNPGEDGFTTRRIVYLVLVQDVEFSGYDFVLISVDPSRSQDPFFAVAEGRQTELLVRDIDGDFVADLSSPNLQPVENGPSFIMAIVLPELLAPFVAVIATDPPDFITCDSESLFVTSIVRITSFSCFRPDDERWAPPQQVTVTVSGDPIGTLVRVITVHDDDLNGVRVFGTELALETSERGDTAVVGVSLGSIALASVTCPVSSEDPTEFTVDDTELFFPLGQWNELVPIRVRGVDDDLPFDGDVVSRVVFGPCTSTDSIFDGATTYHDVVNRFTYLPMILAVEPTTVSLEGGTMLTLIGTGFEEGATVQLNRATGQPARGACIRAYIAGASTKVC